MKSQFQKFPVIILSLMTLLSSCSKIEENKETKSKYLAVKIGNDSNWSIVDDNCNVIVREEYSSKDEISLIRDNVYWVERDGKSQLYSIENPKKPITNEYYDEVTIFGSGRAFFSEAGERINMINTKGEVVKVLPETISGIYAFENGLAPFVSNEGKMGFLDTNGEIAINPIYDEWYESQHVKDGAILVKIDDKKSLIDKNGTKLFDIPEDYELGEFSEGILPVTKKGSKHLFGLDMNGNEIFCSEVECRPLYSFMEGGTTEFKDGYCIVANGSYDFDNFSTGVIDKNGRVAIRMGKYPLIKNLGNKRFLVVTGLSLKNLKCNIVNEKDEIINGPIEHFEDISKFTIGDKHIIKKDGSIYFMNSNGYMGDGTYMSEISDNRPSYIKYVNYNELVEELTKDITKEGGYRPFLGITNPEGIGKKYGLNPENYETKFQLECTSFKIGRYDATLSAMFPLMVAFHEYHTEKVSDGWFESEKRIDDGYRWENMDFKPIAILRLEFKKSDDIDVNVLSKAVGRKIQELGFKETSDLIYELETKDGVAEVQILIDKRASWSSITIYITPERYEPDPC